VILGGGGVDEDNVNEELSTGAGRRAFAGLKYRCHMLRCLSFGCTLKIRADLS